jgi:hypothetical protein
MACLGDLNETVATLHSGEEVKLLSAKTRASDGKEIIEVAFQKWTGWIEFSDITEKIIIREDVKAELADWAGEQAQPRSAVLNRRDCRCIRLSLTMENKQMS